MMKRIGMMILVAACLLTACGGQGSGKADPESSGKKTEESAAASSKDAGKSEKQAETDEAKKAEDAVTTAPPLTFTEPVSLDDAVITALSDWEYQEYGDRWEMDAYIGDDTVIEIPPEIEGKKVSFDLRHSINLKPGTHVRGIVYGEGWKEWDTALKISSEDSNTAFYVEAVRIPASMSSLNYNYINPFIQFTGLKTIEVADGNSFFHVIDGLLYCGSSEPYTLYCYPAGREGESFEQPEGTDVGKCAFANNRNLKKVTNFFGGEDSFAGSYVEEVVCSESRTEMLVSRNFGGGHIRVITLPAAMTSCGVDTLKELPELEAIVLPTENEHYVTDDGVLYYRNKDGGLSLMVYPAARPGEEYTVMDGTTSVSKSCFKPGTPLYLKRLVVPDPDTDTFDFPKGIVELVQPGKQ